MALQYYPEKYECIACGTIQKHYVWSNEVETKRFTCNNKPCEESVGIEALVVEEIQPIFAIKMTTEQIKRERTQRSSEHFNKEIRPTFKKGSDEDRHFSRKKK